MARLLDHLGRPIELSRLTREEAAPSLTGVRTILSDHPSRGLTPQRLAAILLEAEEGDATRYLELAEDMEEKDPNYLAQLGTRKRAVAQLDLTVEAASDTAEDVKDADLVRAFLLRDDVEDVLFDILDAIGKGYSVCEILWETSERQWMPRDLVWRDPRWFAFDPRDGTTLMLREGAGLVPLSPWKYVVHVVKAKSGIPIRGGLARALSWLWLFKNFGLKDWVAFAEVYGQPYRVGKYHPSATSEEKGKLLQAVASIGSDAAAIIPESMMIEFVEAARTNSVDVFERLLDKLDEQMTMAILGQTLTSNVSSKGGSRALGEVHNEVRGDIRRSDARQMEATLYRCLVQPIVSLNHGPRKSYPRIRIGLPNALSPTELVEALTKAVPLGLRVEESVVRDRLGLPDPPKDAVLLRAPSPAAPAAPAPRPALKAVAATAAVHTAGAGGAGGDAVDELVAHALEEAGWEPVAQPVVDPVREFFGRMRSLQEARERLPELLQEMDADRLIELLGRNLFGARLAGLLGEDLAEIQE